MPRIRIKYVDPIRNRHGVEYLYFRRGKGKRTPLRGPVGSPEFWSDYQDASEGYVPDVSKRDPRSIEHLINAYYHWPEFRQLRESTQKDRRRLLNKFCREFGSEQYKLLMPKHARAIRDSKQDTPAGANNLIKALKQVYKGAVERDLVESNPFDNLRKLKEKKQGAKAWTIEDVEKFESVHPIGTPARLALALLLYTGQRRSDVVTMGRQHVKAEWLTVKQVKTGATIEIPVLKDLRAVIDATKCGDLTFLVTSHGRPYTANGFGNAMRAWCDQAGLPDCSAHGLRKAMASRLAEIGCSTSEIMAITGHKSMQELQVYTKAANQRIRANNVRKMLDD